MCAIVLKSMKNLSQIPANIKLGIDWTIKIVHGDSRIHTINAMLENEVMIGGPT
jgi:hypothetical protein